MITLSFLTDFCQSWWLWGILPFLLGLLLGWAIWAKWAKRARELEDQLAKANAKIADLESDLEACGKEKKQAREALSISEDRLRKLKLRLAEYEDNEENESSGSDTYSSSFAESGNDSERTDDDDDSQDLSDNDSSDDSDGGFEGETSDDTESSEESDSNDSSSGFGSSLASSFAGGATGASSFGASSSGAGSSGGGKDYSKLGSGNLQVIEGIGPKMESVLKENGINTYAELASKSEGELRSILNRYGDKYKIIDPADWAGQAGYAARGDWDGLIASQKADGSDSKAEKVMVKLGILKAWKLDDLKAVEGIGPKIAGLLNDAGINTWRELANTSVDRLESILEAAGKRYQLADPSTWPKQAGLAADGNWDELERYQDFLQGGKNPG